MARRPHTSRKDRIDRLRAEKAAKAEPAEGDDEAPVDSKASATAAARKKPRKPSTRKPRKKAKTGRKIIVWAVYDSAFRVVETFAFKQQLAAERLARKLTREKKKPFVARKLKQDL